MYIQLLRNTFTEIFQLFQWHHRYITADEVAKEAFCKENKGKLHDKTDSKTQCL